MADALAVIACLWSGFAVCGHLVRMPVLKAVAGNMARVSREQEKG